MDSITSGKQRQKVRAETWVKIAINPEDIALTPSDVLAKVTKESNYLGGRTNYCISSLFTQCLPFISFQSDLLWLTCRKIVRVDFFQRKSNPKRVRYKKRRIYNRRFQNRVLFQVVTHARSVWYSSNNSINNNFLSYCFLAQPRQIKELKQYSLRRNACVIFDQSKLSRIRFAANITDL